MADTGRLASTLAERYSLLETSVVGAPPSWPWERLPRFLGLLLSAAEANTPQVCSVLLPETQTISYLTATLLALSRLRSEFPQLLHEYAIRGLEFGQSVQVLPDGYVYKYGGLWATDPNSFELRVLDAMDKARRTFPVRQILRLEPTERSRPKGKGATPLGDFQLSALDLLAGIETGGNTSLFRNHVLYLSARIEFETLASSVCLARRDPESAGVVRGSGLSWGHVTEDGSIQRDDRFQQAGEPLVAVTPSPDQLADACEAAKPFSKCVIVNEAEKLARNLQAYDRIAASQRLLIIASHRSADAIDVLDGRGCRVWRMSPTELSLDEALEERCHASGPLGRVFRAVDRWTRLELTPVKCVDDRLERIATHLQKAAAEIRPEQADEESARLLGPLFGLLCRAADLCDTPSSTEMDDVGRRLDLCDRHIGQQTQWQSPAVVSHLRDACTELRGLYRTESQLGKAKGTALLNLLGLFTTSNESVGVVARTASAASATDTWLKNQRIRLPVMPIGAMRETDEFDAIIVTSWPTSRRMGELVGSYAAAHVYLVGYEFEASWFLTFKRVQSRRFRAGQLSAIDKAGLTGLSETFFADVAETASETTTSTTDNEAARASIFRVEDILLKRRKGDNRSVSSREERRPGKYVGFVGATYAYLTQWHHVPVVTALIHNRNPSSQQRVQMRTVDHIARGELVLFREGGDSNIVRSIAEAAVGIDNYAKVRDVADLWRASLLRLAEDADLGLIAPSQIHAALQRWGVTVGVQALRGWLFDESRIGPGEETALDAIARAAGDETLAGRRAEVWEAIRTIRAWHVEAGFRLTTTLLVELQRSPPAVAEHEARIALGQGHAWIVEVEELGAGFEDTPLSQVNRLMWDEGFV